MGLSIEPRRIVRAEVVPMEVDQDQYGIGWRRDDGLDGVDLIGTKAEAEAALKALTAAQIEPKPKTDNILSFPRDTAAS